MTHRLAYFLMTQRDTLSSDTEGHMSYGTEWHTFWWHKEQTFIWHRGTNVMTYSYDTGVHMFLWHRWTHVFMTDGHAFLWHIQTYFLMTRYVLMTQKDARSYDTDGHVLMTQIDDTEGPTFTWHAYDKDVLITQFDTRSYIMTDGHAFLWHRWTRVLMTVGLTF